MTSFILRIILLGSLLPLPAAAQDGDIQAGVSLSIQSVQDIWAGQQVTLNLDLKTNGLSFSNTHFNLPEVGGAFLMQTDTTTIKLTEKVNGQSWQVVRYPLALYPQKAGQLEIPPIDVRFGSSAGFGTEERVFALQSEPLVLSVNLPPGVSDDSLVITTSLFELDYDWQPETGIAHTGDAFTLTVNRRAKNISAMLLPPLPVYQLAGLSAYPQAPEVTDNTNRGDLTGVRTDRIIWVVEKPGSYDIPGIRFQWWDPDNRELKQQLVTGLQLDILPSGSGLATTNMGDGNRRDRGFLLTALILVTGIIIIGAMRIRSSRKRLDPVVKSEKSAFTDLQKACKSNQPGETLSAIHTWLACASDPKMTRRKPVTLSEFAKNCNDSQLAADVQKLQEALVSSDRNWRGDKLLSSLKRVRHETRRRKIVHSRAGLAPLNP